MAADKGKQADELLASLNDKTAKIGKMIRKLRFDEKKEDKKEKKSSEHEYKGNVNTRKMLKKIDV